MPKFYTQHVDYSLRNLILISVDTIIWMYLAAIQLAPAQRRCLRLSKEGQC